MTANEMDISHNKAIWELAAMVLERHGTAASAYATGRARDTLEAQDNEGYEIWLAVLDAIEALTRRPAEAEKVDGGSA